MTFPRMTFLLLLFTASITTSQAQSVLINNPLKSTKNFTEFSAILVNGKVLVQEDTPDGPLTIAPSVKGKLSVSKIDRTRKDWRILEPIGFKIAIKNYHSNALWMLSDKTYYEVDLEELQKNCDMGDQIMIMTVDRKHQLPRHELRIMDGC